MKILRNQLLWLAVLCLSTLPAAADGQRIDARFFPGPDLNIEARWLVPVLSPRGDPTLNSLLVAQTASTELRLTIPPDLVGKRARIYARLPSATTGLMGNRGLETEWTTQGVFRPGTVIPGARVLFFEGVVSAPVLRDFVTYTFRVDANYVTGPVRFDPVYEIEAY